MPTQSPPKDGRDDTPARDRDLLPPKPLPATSDPDREWEWIYEFRRDTWR